MKFADIPGYGPLKSKLVSMLKQNRIGHALIFAGESGSGNLTLSIAFAQFISCLKPLEDDSCGKCSSCVKFEKLIHPDLHFYFPTTTSSEVPKNALSQKYYEKWRSYVLGNPFATFPEWLRQMDPNKKDAIISTDESSQVIKDLSLKSYESEFRFAIIWLPEKMNVHSSNKLLKIIEEPPKNAYFFLVTEKIESMLQTIVSRAQSLRLGLIPDEDMIEWLRSENPTVNESELIDAVKRAEGVPKRALDLLDENHDREELIQEFITWARLCYQAHKQMPGLIDFSEIISSWSREDQNRFIDYGIQFFRNGMMLNSDSRELVLSDENEIDHIGNFSKLLNSDNTGTLLEAFGEATTHLARYGNAKIIFLDLSLQFARNINAKNVHL